MTEGVNVKVKSIDCEMIFPTPIWYVEYEDFEKVNQGILDEMAKVDWDANQKARGLQKELDHRHGEDIFITPDLVPSAQPIVDGFANHCHQIARELGWDLEHNQVNVTALWAHVTPPGKSTLTHHHAPEHLSCAYYVRAPAACGNLRFEDDRKHRIIEPEPRKFGLQTEIPAKEGRMVIFPSWLSHYVTENCSNETRVSLSLNAKVLPKETH
ncbi:MAG: TIGR02466 family protein [Acidiferrobacterales bacterium]